MTSLVAGILFALAIALPMKSFAGLHRQSGIAGDTVINTCPVQPAAGCEQPYPTTIQVLTKKRHFVMDVTTDNLGHFSVILHPGKYVLVPATSIQAPGPVAQETTVRVRRKEVTLIKIVYDSGIR